MTENLIIDQEYPGTAREKELTTRQALRLYGPALFWSIIVSMCIVMEGYDAILIHNFFAYPAFAQKFGHFDDTTATFQLSAAWQVALSNAVGVGSFLGTIANGYLVPWYGPRKIFLGALLVLASFIAITFTAPNVWVLCVGEFLCGIPWGMFATMAPAYASEVLPLCLRAYLTTFTNMCFILGQLVAAGVLQGLPTIDGSWSYRTAFALQWVWPVILLPVLFFMPESPWHLVRMGRLEAAEESLVRLQSKYATSDVKETLAMIVSTNNAEERVSRGTSYYDCFRGIELRRTEIACMAFVGQVLSGISFAYNSTYFFQQIGLQTSDAYKLNVGGIGIALLGTIISWFCIMPYVGRRRMYLFGMVILSMILLLIGLLSIKSSNDTIVIGQIALVFLWTLTFQLSIGQLGWAIPAEIGSTRLRQKTICLARTSYYLFDILAKTIEPYLINPTKWNLKGFTGLFWFGTALIAATWTFFRLPETKGRSFEELDNLFERKVPTRKFASYKIERSTSSGEPELVVQ
ncbi:unnamed protein product [Blumeria hordei]|uniref:Major facilitator superfamily (MFS) profile domain-containing protein n=1 Tax=Blumeria hordei TaxID=2867405 RepID=A0A383UPI8_BLUHO|nr:unnamed protein product [Blumeria hordei]